MMKPVIQQQKLVKCMSRDPAGGSGVWAASAAVNGVGATSALQEHGHCGITACPSARSEVAALRVKVDGLQAKLREKQLELDSALESAQRHRAEADRLREDNARQLALNAELSRQIDCCEATRGSYEEVKSRSGQAVFELQEQLRRAQDRTRDLEAKLADRDVRDAGRSSSERRLTEFAASLAYHLEVSESASLDTLINRASNLAQEAATLRARSRSQEEQLAAHEAEARANRETIQRLLAEVNREHRAAAAYQTHQSEFRTGTEKLTAERDDLARQVELLEARLESNRRVLEATKAELAEKDSHVAKVDSTSRELQRRAEDSEQQLASLLQSLASTLSTQFSHVTATEEAVKERVCALCRDYKELSEASAAHEERSRKAAKQLEAQVSNSREREAQARRAEVELRDMHERLRAMESELAAGDVVRDGLAADRQKFYKYMQQLAEAMKMDQVGADIGFDMLGDALLARAQQLARLSDDAAHDKASTVYSLQRKVKALKEQLESRDLHMDLLRKKIGQLEERAAGRVEVERERDNENGRVRRLQKQLEKSQAQLEQARAEIVSLKAQLLECSNLKLAALEQDRELAALENTMEKLEQVRQKQAKKISLLKSEVETRQRELGDKSTAAEGALSNLSSELRTTKSALEEARRREHQLLDLRAVVGRMLGLDVESLAVPDYEIVNRLERLIQAHQSNVYTAVSANEAMQDMQASFLDGYTDAQRHQLSLTAASKQEPKRPPCPMCRMSRCSCRRPLESSGGGVVGGFKL
uniref:Coiled-coil domain-containing protein 170 n=1 Tax=Macrostomum lignano TaxID=282301 RepID=A0A1I8G8S9_9PLAT